MYVLLYQIIASVAGQLIVKITSRNYISFLKTTFQREGACDAVCLS